MPSESTATDFRTPLPKAVRAVVDSAEKAYATATKPAEEPKPPEAKSAEAKPAPAEETKPTEAKPTPVKETKPAEAKPTEPQPKAAERVLELEQSLARAEYHARQHQGRYDKLKADTDKRISDLESQLASLKQNSSTSGVMGVTAEEREEFGEDLINLVDRIAAEKYGGQISELQAQLAAKTTSAPAAPTVDNEDAAFYDYLNKVLPDWEKQNADPEFLEWLKGLDPVAGQTRQELLLGASARKDAIHVASIFTAYRSATQAASNVFQGGAPETDGVTLESLAAPTSSGVGGSNSVEKVTVFTQDEVAKFYADVTAGRFRNDPDGKLKMEQDITTAAREGRIIDKTQLAQLQAQGSV